MVDAGPHGGPGSARDLASSPAEKRAAALSIETGIAPGTRRAGEWADEDTAAAVTAFGARDGAGWLTSAALRKAHHRWTDQVRDLMDRLSTERDALRSTNRILTSTDLATGSTLREISVLDGF
ncbi:hypothetical protein [Streptomyces naganishii]|uniref:Uncharacterized protein n=1 Tax=Streptomyces naganishii JCM 4654 TaxID=1306179 RepID=A0A918Y8F5_9ACTN|nr:hypothetical protein [Streptomyces naganishii]GHD94183.1 hypothetical protein GCM10010508_53880 [Streptomyces naganishii JCM 4654]